MEKAIPYRGDAPYIFISYAHRDAQSVLPIIGTMQASGFRIWFDEGIDPGTEWDNVIAEQIEKSSYFLAFVSENYLASENCKDELNFARDLGKHRLLVYLENVTLPAGMAMRMNRIQSVFKYKYADEAAFYKVLYSADGIYDMCDGEKKEEKTEPVFTAQPQGTQVTPPVHTPKVKGEIPLSAIFKNIFSHIRLFFRKPTLGSVFTRLFILLLYAAFFCIGINVIVAGSTFLVLSVPCAVIALILTPIEKKKHPERYAHLAEEKGNRSFCLRIMAYIALAFAFLTYANTPAATSFFLFWTGYCFFASFIPHGYSRVGVGPLTIPRALVRVIAILFSLFATGIMV